MGCCSGMARLQSSVLSSPCLSLLLLLLLLPAVTATQYSSLCHSPAPAADLPAGGVRPSTHLRVPFPFGYFSGGKELLFATDPYLPRSFSFTHRLARETTDPAVLHLFVTFTLSGSRVFRRRDIRSHSVSFDLEGYYSTASPEGELCMVGSGSRARDDGSGVIVLRDVALRLRFPHPATLSRPFVTGRLDSADFRTVTLVDYAGVDYKYAESASCPPPPVTVRNSLLMLNANFTCHRLRALLMRGSSYSLEYGAGHASKPNTFALRTGHRRMYVNQMHCDADGAVGAYLVFYNNQSDIDSLASNYTLPRRNRHSFAVGDEELVADGFWDSSRNQLCLKACSVARSRPSGADMVVRECRMGMNFWFPSVWSIRDRSAVAGLIWNTNNNDDGSSGTEKMPGVVSVSRTSSYMDSVSGIKYNYTRVDDAMKYYHSKAELSKQRKGSFPGNYSYRDYAFSFNLKEQGGYGSAWLVTVGSTIIDEDRSTADGILAAEISKGRLLNVSYDMHVYQYQVQRHNSRGNMTKYKEWRVLAEGVYDTQTGSLCMVACQVIDGSSDCEVLVTVQFAPVESKTRQRAIGAISSLRKKGDDPLFFETVDIVADGMYGMEVAESIQRMDMESVMLVLSMTVSCVLTLLQLRHARRNPGSLPATSVMMLAVLALGYVIPLTLNFEAMFVNSSKHFVEITSGGGWLDVNEIMLRASTVLALVLQLRLLQLAWSGRSSSRHEHDAERNTLWICLPLYLLGGALIWIIHMNDGADAHQLNHRARARIGPPSATLSDHLVSYAGLILDGFLLPQVIFNAFSASTVNAISPWFYAGGTVIRAAPHAYDVFRARNYVPSGNGTLSSSWSSSYVYASPRDGLFSVAWDIVVPCGGALLAVVLFLQQWLGGAFMCCLQSRRSGEYEMVSTTTS